MINFDFKGITIDVAVEMTPRNYLDGDKRSRKRFDREVWSYVHFWEFRIENGNLHELAYVKSTLNYFMQAYWKRSSKEGSKIDLDKALYHQSRYENPSSLHFVARQKDKKHFLHICLRKDGGIVEECYLDGQEVILLDIAIGKLISLLTPRVQEAHAPLF